MNDNATEEITVELNQTDSLTSLKLFLNGQKDVRSVNISVNQQNGGLFDPFALLLSLVDKLVNIEWIQHHIQILITGENDTGRLKSSTRTIVNSLEYRKKLKIQMAKENDKSSKLEELALDICNSTSNGSSHAGGQRMTIECDFSYDEPAKVPAIGSTIVMSVFTIGVSMILAHLT